jgi:hypothetical protein
MVSEVAKIHNASSAASGTATSATIFVRIDQLRVLTKAPPRRRSRGGYALGRIRNRVTWSQAATTDWHDTPAVYFLELIKFSRRPGSGLVTAPGWE